MRLWYRTSGTGSLTEWVAKAEGENAVLRQLIDEFRAWLEGAGLAYESTTPTLVHCAAISARRP